MIVTASKRYFSRLVPPLDGGFFSNFCGETSRRESASEQSKQTVKENTMLQSELLRKTRSSYSLSIIYLHLLHFGRFMDELLKPCERLKLPVVIKNYCRQKPPDCLRLMILEAVLRLLVLKRGNLFDVGELLTKLTVTETTILVSLIVATMITFKVSSQCSAQDA